MAKHARIYKIPEKYIVEVNGLVVGFGKSGYTASEMANAYGAKTMEVLPWEDLLLRTSSRPVSSHGSSEQEKSKEVKGSAH